MGPLPQASLSEHITANAQGIGAQDFLDVVVRVATGQQAFGDAVQVSDIGDGPNQLFRPLGALKFAPTPLRGKEVAPRRDGVSPLLGRCNRLGPPPGEAAMRPR